jgi:hypothetical protein
MKKITACAIAAACGLVPATAWAATQWSVEWSTPQAISTAPAPGGGIENGGLATSGDGTRAVAVWAQHQGSAKFRVVTARTDDGGATWSAPDPRSSGTVNAEFPDVTMSDDGTRATVIWYTDFTLVRAASTADGGVTWTNRTIAGPISASRNPQLASSADGTRLVAIWGEFSTNDVLRISRSSDGGNNWSTGADLSDPANSADDPAVALSADGLRAVAAYVQDNGANGLVRIRTSSDGGANWDPAVTLSDAGQNAGQPHITLSDDGKDVAVAWVRSDGLNSRVQIRRSDDFGANWTATENLSVAGQDASGMQIAGSADGNDLTIAWQLTGASDRRIQSRSTSDGGLTWSPPATHSAEASTGDDPDVAVSSDGTTAAVSWYRLIDFNPSRVEVVTSADSGATWSTSQALSDTAFDADSPRIAMSSNGRRLITTWIGSDATDRLTRAAAGTLRTVPRAPSTPTASAGDAQLDASWSPPADDGGSPVTSYTATASPGGQTCVATTTSCTIGGLTNGTAYTVTVIATNALGAGVASPPSNAVTPIAPPAPPVPPPAPTPPPDPEPLKTKVVAKANDKASKLKIKIKPDLGKKKQWEFVVKVKKKGEWKTIKTKKDKTKVYETEGSDHKLTLDLDKGKYKAKSKEARGYSADTSEVVKLKK